MVADGVTETDVTRVCEGCRDGAGFSLPFSMAFQPIIDLATHEVFAHEALVRGVEGQGAQTILSAVDETNLYAFDQQCRVKAIQHAARLDLVKDGSRLSINFLPNAVYEPKACIKLTLAAAEASRFPVERIIFELTEGEQVDSAHLGHILKSYKEMGFATAIDDFGAGFAGLNLLAKFQPDIIKLDMDLIRGIDRDRVRRTIVHSMARTCEDLGIRVLAEGIETREECEAVRELGVTLQQGYLFARPAFETLAAPVFPEPRQGGTANAHAA